MVNNKSEKDSHQTPLRVKPPTTMTFSDEDPETPERYWERRQRNS